MPILCGSTAMDVTPGRAKSKGIGSSRNGTTMPPNAASTWKKSSCCPAILARSAMGSTIPYSVVPATPTRAIVFRIDLILPRQSASIRKSFRSGTLRISRPRMSQAFLKEKCADSGQRSRSAGHGTLLPSCIRVPLQAGGPGCWTRCRRSLHSRPHRGSGRASPNLLIEELFERAGPGKEPGSPRFVSMNMQCARTATEWGSVHMEHQDIIDGRYPPASCGRKK